MKTVDEYTAQELVELSSEELERLVDIEVMKSGIVLPDVPTKPGDFKIEKTAAVWEICNGSEVICAFPSEEIAQAVLSASKGEFLKESYIYEIGYEFKFMEACKKADIVKRYVYDESDLRARAKKLKVSSSEKTIYENKKREYDEAFGKIQRLRDHVMSAYWQAMSDKENAEKIYRTFERYKQLSNGDSDIALGFLKNAFTGDAIENANTFLSADKQIA
ncbi:MAG: hypothetical protein CV087_08260 [Candidatus Brocadia sp. WS118]|nr:MAG: hypothetical protein CV087_08260 [Candidatus Brocadia sp. WS118]